jgi:hypothetical protein
MTPEMSPIAWRHPRTLSVALVLFALVAVPIGLAGPERPADRHGLELTAQLRQQARADVTAGFPAPPHPDAPPRGPAG